MGERRIPLIEAGKKAMAAAREFEDCWRRIAVLMERMGDDMDAMLTRAESERGDA